MYRPQHNLILHPKILGYEKACHKIPRQFDLTHIATQICPESRVRNGQDTRIPHLRIKRIQKLYTTNLTSRHAGAMERSCSYNAKTGKETERYVLERAIWVPCRRRGRSRRGRRWRRRPRWRSSRKAATSCGRSSSLLPTDLISPLASQQVVVWRPPSRWRRREERRWWGESDSVFRIQSNEFFSFKKNEFFLNNIISIINQRNKFWKKYKNKCRSALEEAISLLSASGQPTSHVARHRATVAPRARGGLSAPSRPVGSWRAD